MVKQNRSFKRRTVTRWALSYLFVALVPILTVLLITVISMSLFSDSINYSNRIAVSYVQDSVVNLLNSINAIKAEIIVDTSFEEIRTATDSQSISAVYVYQRAMDIRHLEQSNALINKIYLYSSELDWYLCGENWGRISTMSSDGTSLPLDQKSIDSILGKTAADVEMHDISDSQILIVVPITFAKSLNMNGLCLGVVVNRSVLFSSVMDSNHDVVLYSERSNKVIYDITGRFEVGKTYDELGDLEYGTTVNGKNLVASVGESSILQLKCIVIMDKSTYFHNLYLMVQIVIGFVLVAVIIGILSALRFVRRDWGHFSSAASQSGLNLEEVPSEAGTYAPFVSSVSLLKNQNAEMSSVISRQNESLLESTIKKLLDGDSSVTRESLEALGVSLLSDLFYVLIISPARNDVSKIQNILAKDAVVIPFVSDYGDSFIVNPTSAKQDDYLDNVRTAFEQLGGEFLSASGLHENLQSIRDCVLEAVSVHEYQKDHGIELLSYPELEQITRQSTYQFTLEENMSLQKAIKEGNGESAKALVNKVIDKNRANGVSPKALRFLLFSISGNIIRTVNSLDERFSEAIPQLNFPLILQSENFQKSLEGVMETIDSCCFSIAAVQAQYSDSTAESYSLYRKALEYIHENYGNPMMNVSSVSDTFGVSIAYLSRVFKKYHSINISDYITAFRLDRAKELLGEGHMVGDVAQKCGFGSLRTFLRVFKSVEGITPGQYKGSVSKEN